MLERHPFLLRLPEPIRDRVLFRFTLAAEHEAKTPADIPRVVHSGQGWAALSKELGISEEHRDGIKLLLRLLHEEDELAMDFARQVFDEAQRRREVGGDG